MPLRSAISAALLAAHLAACATSVETTEQSVFTVPFGVDSAAVEQLMQVRGLRPVRVSNTGSGRYLLYTGRTYSWLGGDDSTRVDSTAHVVVAMSVEGRLAGLAVSADFRDSAAAHGAFGRLADEATGVYGEPVESSEGRRHWEVGDTLSVNVAVRGRPAANGTTHVVAFTITHVGMAGRGDEARSGGINEAQQ